MKTVLFSILAISLGFTSYSQIEKGIYALNGRFNLSSLNSSSTGEFTNSTNKEFQFVLAPSLEKVILENLSIGGGLVFQKIYSNSSNTFIDPSMGNSTASSDNTSFGVSANTTKYFYLKDNFYFTLNGGINYQRGISKISPNFSVNYFGVAIAPGFDFIMTPAFALSSRIDVLNYQRIASNDSEVSYNSTSNDFRISINQSSFFIGLKYFFNPKKEKITN